MDKLGIDPLLLGTQAFNFAIILFVLKKFAYEPVLTMLEKRKKEIQDGLKLKSELEERKKEIEEARKKTLDEARKEGQRMIKSAVDEAKKRGSEIVALEKEQAQADRKRQMAEIEQERKKIVGEAKNQALSYAVLISEKLLGKKLDPAEQRRLLTEIVGELKKS